MAAPAQPPAAPAAASLASGNRLDRSTRLTKPTHAHAHPCRLSPASTTTTFAEAECGRSGRNTAAASAGSGRRGKTGLSMNDA